MPREGLDNPDSLSRPAQRFSRPKRFLLGCWAVSAVDYVVRLIIDRDVASRPLDRPTSPLLLAEASRSASRVR
jgi:hypothetical protein